MEQTPYHLGIIADGIEGTAQTLDIMSKLARNYRRDPRIIEKARSIIRHVPGKDYVGEARAIWEWVRANAKYVRDPRDVETLKLPQDMLERCEGDCDDQALLVATLLEAIGHPTRFKAVGYQEPGFFEHVIAETKIGDQWIPLDTTEESFSFGYFPPNPIARMVHHV